MNHPAIRRFLDPTASEILDAVETWAGEDWTLLRETSALTAGGTPWANGLRMDGVLIPLSWEAPSYKRCTFRQGIVAVEVKVTREDFLAGVRRNQFAQYADFCSGVYLAAPADIVRVSEVPDGVGFLQIVNASRGLSRSFSESVSIRAVCRRHPRFQPRPLTPEQCWRVLWCGLNRLRTMRADTVREHAAALDRLRSVTGKAVVAACVRATEAANPHKQRAKPSQK